MTTAPLNRPIGPARQPVPTGGGAVVIDPVRILRMYWVPLVLSIFVGVGVGIGGYLALVRIAPSYESVVGYEVTPPQTSLRDDPVGTASRDELERFIATQVFTITGDGLLREALKKPEVRNSEWAKGYSDREGRLLESDALRELRKIASARPRPGTNTFALAVRTSNAVDASALATAIDKAFFELLAQRKLNVTNDRRGPLSQQVQRLTTVIDNIDQTIVRKMKDFKLETSSDSNQTSSVEVELAAVQPRRAEANQRQAAVKERLAKLEASMGAEGGVPMFTDEQKELAERDPVVLQTKQRLTEYQVQDGALRDRGIGAAHPERIRMKALMDNARSEVERARNEALRKLFDADLEAARRAVDGVRQEVVALDNKLSALQDTRASVAQAQLEISQLKITRVQLVEERDRIQRSLNNLDELTKLQNEQRIDRVIRSQQASTPDELAFPRLPTTIIAGIVLALGLTLTAVVLRELLDQRIRTTADAALIPGARLLGFVPRADEDPTKPASVETAFRDSPTGAISEAFRQIRAPLIKKMHNSNYKSLLVVPAAPGSGATTAVTNLAMGAAASDIRVLVIDANLRRPGLHKVLKLAEGPGLADVLAKKCDLAMALQSTSTPNLTLLAAGTASLRNVPERLSTDAMTAILDEAKAKFDLVIIDCSPALVTGDAQALANRCDAAIMVVRAFGEKRGQVSRLRAQLSEGRAEVLGLVVNQLRAAAGGYMRKNIQMAYDYQTNASST